ncbi:MAG: FG-GAP repeat protein, partial [Deltaproteobacteria bacterium]|nr:FG-GAP repeat protein [Nannocystaceae bacterium]
MRSLRPLHVLVGSVVIAAACGDDTSATSQGEDSSSTGVDESSSSAAPGDSSSSEGSSDTSTTAIADDSSSSSGELDESSSTGAPNNPPIAIDDLYAMVMDDAPLTVAASLGVLANDSDPDGDPITVAGFDALSSAGGTVVVEDGGALTYTPPAGFWGEDGFDYTIVDDDGATAGAHVRVMVAPTTVSLGSVTDGVGGFMIEGTAEGDQAGYSLAGGGDVDGDGLADIIVGAYTADVEGNGEGRVFVAFGKSDGTAVALLVVVEGTGGFVIDGIDDGDRTGYSVAHGGDVDGDGLADIIVGAYTADVEGNGEGRVFV